MNPILNTFVRRSYPVNHNRALL